MLITSILDQIRRDVASFADPGTVVEITDRSLTWIRSRASFSAQLIRRAGAFPDVAYNGREYGYTSFLASEALADLKDLATTISAVSIPPPHFVPVYATSEDVDGGGEFTSEASDVILKQTVDPASLPLAATRVLFVHGNAGTGKTSTLLHVTRLQAERYLLGQTNTLLLYLDAQGKGLSQLEDVMARALQDLRAKFTYHSVAALSRRHCVIPIVDGFDELIGPSSAREAFSNLAQFLAQLDCEGALIASSRSGFIDYRTLHERAAELAASQRLSYDIVPVEILPWGDQSIGKYCEGRTPGSSDLKDRVFRMMPSAAGDLVRKPFFLAKICDILQEGGDIDVTRDVTHQVIDASLVREASKLRDERGRELLTAEQHRVFCEIVADEMWSLGSPEIDCDTVRLLAEIVAEQFRLSQRDSKTVIDRSIAHGLLTVVPARTPEKRAFEHELFRFEFQASSLTKLLETQAEGRRDYLRRAELPLEIVSRVPQYGLVAKESIAGVIADLSSIVAGAPNSQFSATNAGSLTWALVRDREDLPEGLRLSGFYLRSHDLGKCRFVGAQIRNSVFEGVSLEQAVFERCNVENSQFVRCKFGSNTRWDNTEVEVVQFVGVARVAGGRVRESYDPKEIERVLLAAGAVLPVEGDDGQDGTVAPDAEARIELVERLLTHARSHFYLSRQESWFRNNLGNTKAWGEVESVLRRHRLLEEVQLIKSGRPETFLRLTTAPDKVLQARVSVKDVPANAVSFWRELTGSK